MTYNFFDHVFHNDGQKNMSTATSDENSVAVDSRVVVG